MPKAITDADYVKRWTARCIVTERGCWEWQGFCHGYWNLPAGQRGYAEAYYKGKNRKLSRVMLEMTQRPLRDGEVACHKCDNPPCINPDHLWIGTQSENRFDEVAKGRNYYATRTHCPKGHEYSHENTLRTKGLTSRHSPRRQCKACSRIAQRIRAGWTPEQAAALPKTPRGYRPVAGSKSHRSQTTAVGTEK